MTTITAVDAWEVLDSRGNPTVRVRVDAEDASGTFTVPAGASTGTYEAVERRDGGDRFGGLGVRDAVEAVIDELAPVVSGRPVTDQEAIDEELVRADGTADLSRLGANAVLGVSGAVAHAAAESTDQPLYEYLSPDDPGAVPMPLVQILGGGLHAEGGIEIQDFQAVPVGADTYGDALEMVWDVRQAVRDTIVEAGHPPLIADEGGFSPPFDSIEDAFDLLLLDGIVEAGYEPGSDVAIGLDVAATHFFEDGTYDLESLDRTLDPWGMVDLVEEWVESYPIVSVEDPLVETHWEAWSALTERIGNDVQVLGDDFLATNEDRLDRAIEERAANAVLVKPNQAGTMTRAISVVETAQAADMGVVVSARSGETCDTTIADLAVALDAGQIKICSISGSERLSKYNRLIEIDRTVPAFAGASSLAR